MKWIDNLKNLFKFKTVLVLIYIIGFATGCATLSTSDQEIPQKTMYTDLQPEVQSRSDYYTTMAISAVEHDQFDQAIELFRLALLHNPENHLAQFKLAQTYSLNDQYTLSIREFENYFALKKPSYVPTEFEMNQLFSIYEKTDSYFKLISWCEKYFEQTSSSWALWKAYEYHLKQGSYEQAFGVLSLLENKKEDSFKLSLARAALYKEKQDYNKSLENLMIAEKRKPLDEFTLTQIIWTNYQLKNWKNVHEFGLKYSRYYPYKLEMSEMWSVAALQLEDYDTALSELKKQKKIFPDSIGLDYKIAHILFLKKDYLNAEEAYKDIYDLTGSDQSVYYLAQIHLVQNKYDQASENMASLASTSEYYGLAQVQLARLEWNNNQQDLAMNRLRKAHLQRPDNLEIYQEYAQYLIWSKNYMESVALLEKAFFYHPKDDQLRLLAAFNHFKLNNERKFYQDIQIAIEANPSNAEIYAVIAELWYEKRKPATEIQYLAEKALKHQSTNKNIKPLLAWALLQQNQLTQAVALFEEFYDQNPKELFYVESLAQIYGMNSLKAKTENLNHEIAILKIENTIKGELDYFNQQTQKEKTKSDSIKTRLPASLEQ